MGKGKRNRERSMQERLANPAAKNLKNKKKSGMPSWLTSVIAILVVIVILLPLIISAVRESGFFERRRILIESKTGEFDVNQQMATFIAWEALYESGLTYYQYVQYGIYQDNSGITSLYTADEYAMNIAYSSIQNNLRDCVDNVTDALKQYVAVCDLAHEEGVTLTEEDLLQVDEVVTWLNNLRSGTSFSSLDKYLGYMIGTGVKEKDVRAATKLVILYNKYMEQKQIEVDGKITLEDLTNYRLDNPASFYKMDYLVYAVKDKELSEKLKACKTPEEFSNLVIDIIFDEHFQTLYNQYTLLDELTEILKEELDGKTDGNDGNALSEAWEKLGVTANTEYDKNDENLDEALKTWLFASKRKQFDSDVITAENGIYLVSLYSEKAVDDKVQARVKFYEFKKGEEIKDTLLDVLKKEFHEEEVSYDYKTAAEKAEALKEALKAENADINKLLTDAAAVVATGVLSDTAEVPAAIRKKVLDSAVKAEDILIVEDGDLRYVVYVRSMGTKTDPESEEELITADIDYVEYTTDLFCLLRDELQELLAEDYSDSETASFEAEPSADYKKFLFALKEGEGLVSDRTHGDTIVVETTTEANNVTTYTAYMAIQNTDHDPNGEMLYFDKSAQVTGGYLLFEKQEAAQEALESLTGKTGDDLQEAFSALTSDVSSNKVSFSTANKLTTIKALNEDMGAWMFDTDRKDGDLTIVEKKDSDGTVTGYYLVSYVKSQESWAVTARSLLLSETLQDWLDDLSAPYTVNEKVLKKIGEPTPDETEAAE